MIESRIKNKFRIFFAFGGFTTSLLIGLIAGLISVLVVRVTTGSPAIIITPVCFIRDVAGATGITEIEALQYVRPEIVGSALGAFILSTVFREKGNRGMSSPLLRFVFGVVMMLSMLVFLGCPIRAFLRLSIGDFGGLVAVGGIIAGAALGVFFLKRGFSWGESVASSEWLSRLVPVGSLVMFLVLLWRIWDNGVNLGRFAWALLYPIPGHLRGGAQDAPLIVALIAGAVVGALAQRSRFCTIGGVRDAILTKQPLLLGGLFGLIVGAMISNLLLKRYYFGLETLILSNSEYLYIFLSLLIIGIAATLLGGCPLRQLILASQGDSNSTVTVLGMIFGIPVAKVMNVVSTTEGVSKTAPFVLFLALFFMLYVAMTKNEIV